MSLGNKLMALGQWIEKRFPEKLTATEVKARMRTIEVDLEYVNQERKSHETRLAALADRVAALEVKAETFNSDINKTKVMLLTQRQTR
jgi:hypothetical protein